jgi:hypothetical protein
MPAIAFDSWMYDLSLWEALAMQAVGVLGETFIQLGLPPGHTLLVNSLLRFIAFDAAGLPALGAALLLTRSHIT